MKAMILSAGLGTRLKPWTDKHPKALAVINGKTLLQRNIAYLQSFGIYHVIVNVHHFAKQIIDAIEKNNGWNSTIAISDESDEVLETGGGLKKAAWYFSGEENFVLMNADVLTDLNLHAMINAHVQSRALATLAVTNRQTSRYFLFDEHNRLCGWRNTKTGEEKIMRSLECLQQKAFSGIHVISTKIFSLMHLHGKFSMVDIYLQLAKENNIQAFDHSASKFIDVGKPESLLAASALFI